MDSFIQNYNDLNTNIEDSYVPDTTTNNSHEPNCFIDASQNLSDDSEQSNMFIQEYKHTSMPILEYYQPCASNSDISPNDSSGSNDNDDSLEQADTHQYNNPPILSTLTVNKSRECVTLTPNNSIITQLGKDFDTLELSSPKKIPKPTEKPSTNNVFTESEHSCMSGGSSLENPLLQQDTLYSRSPLSSRCQIENIPIVSGHVPDIEETQSKPQKTSSTASAWIVDMSDSDNASNKIALHPTANDVNTEKKTIFSMFIGLGDKSAPVKEMPVSLSSSINNKKKTETVSKTRVTKEKVANNTAVEWCESSCDTFIHPEAVSKDPSLSTENIINDRNIAPSKLVTEVQVVHEDAGLYVKLSDLDKPWKAEQASQVSVFSRPQDRMSSSIPNNDWKESSQSNNSKSDNLMSSFHSENTLSLNRLFPNLKNEFSRSLPGSLSNSRSPARLDLSSSYSDVEEQPFEDSDSIHYRNCLEKSRTDEMSKLIESCESRLGQDLLRMFFEEIAHDVVVEAAGRRIKAHKCILSSRCQYFAGILSGRWIPNSGNVIPIPKPYSYNVVHFALCHIYSGISTIPENLNMTELLTLAEMMGLEGIKEAVSAKLVAQYCHNFHEPCSVCIVGVLECFPIAMAFNLEDLSGKISNWIAEHFLYIWPTRSFGTMPGELREKCLQEKILNLTIENICQTVIETGEIKSCLQSNRWSMNVRSLCERLLNAAAQYAAPKLEQTIRATAALACDLSPVAEVAFVDFISKAMERAPPAEACRTYAFLTQNGAKHHKKPDPLPDNLLEYHAECWRYECERALVRSAPSVVITKAYKELPLERRTWLRELGCLGRTPKPKEARRQSPTSRDIELVRTSFVPYSPRPRPQRPPEPQKASARVRPAPNLNRSTDSVPVRTTKAQEEREKYNKMKRMSVERVASGKPRSFQDVRPRYLSGGPERRGAARSTSSESSTREPQPVGRARAAVSAPRPRAAAPPPRPRTAAPACRASAPASTSLTSIDHGTFTKVVHSKKTSLPDRVPQAATRNTGSPSKIPTYVNLHNGLRTHSNLRKGQEKSHRPTKAKVEAVVQSEANHREIPLMERSGTFLKDEAMFQDIVNHDIDNEN